MADIDYYFSLVSPFAYLGHTALREAARDTGAVVRYRPSRIFDLFAANGGLPLGQRAPARQRYRLYELQRWRARRDLPLNLAPKGYPVDPGLADRCAIVLIEAGADPGDYALSVFDALWAQEQDIADPAVLARLLSAHGFDAERVLADADSAQAEAIYRRNTEAAIAADLPGLPGYVLDGEPFWGQDRIDDLHAALRSARAPFRLP